MPPPALGWGDRDYSEDHVLPSAITMALRCHCCRGGPQPGRPRRCANCAVAAGPCQHRLRAWTWTWTSLVVLMLQLSSSHFVTATEVIELDYTQRNLTEIPTGNASATSLILSYNRLESIGDGAFSDRHYRHLERVLLNQNRIHTVSRVAFRDLRRLLHVDLSDNRIGALDPYLFSGNRRLERLVLANNRLQLRRVHVFLSHYALESLTLAGNNVTEVYPINFLGLPGLKRLSLGDNPLRAVRDDAFRSNTALEYLSLASTAVDHVSARMFAPAQLPALLDVTDTRLAVRFEPPLRMLSGQALLQMLQTQQEFVSAK